MTSINPTCPELFETDINAPHGEPFYGESQPKGTYGIRNSAEGANDGLDIWDKLLKRHAHQISFVFSGHVFGGEFAL